MSKQTDLLHWEVFNIGTPTIPTAYYHPKLQGRSYPFIPFGDEPFNLFPQQLSELSRESSTLHSILMSKVAYVLGDEQVASDTKLEAYLQSINKNESFSEVLEKVAYDYLLTGNAYVQVERSNGRFNIYHVDASKCRLKAFDLERGETKPTHVLISPNWSEYRRKGFKPVEVPLYQNAGDETKHRHFMFHIKDYECGFPWYGLPDWVGSIPYVKLEGLIGKFNTNLFENGLFSSGILEVMTRGMSPEQAKRMVSEIRSKLTGVEQGNSSKMFVLMKDSEEQKTRFTEVNRSYEGSFMELKELCTQSIITACRWYSSLAGIQSTGQLGSNQQIRNEYEIALRSTQRLRQKLLQPFKQIFKLGGFTSEVQIQNEAPISIQNEIPIAEVLTRNEMRELLGYEAL